MKTLKIARLNKWVTAFLAMLTIFFSVSIYPTVSQTSSPQGLVFEQVWETVNDNFFDPDLNGVDWEQMRTKYAPLAAKTRSTEELAVVINQMLGELKTSHTYFYTQAEPAYYQIAGIFREYILKDLKEYLPDGKLEYTGIGIYTEDIDNQTFIKAILEGSAAAKAGLRVGDRILSVDGKPFEPIASFAGKAGETVEFQIVRQQDASPQAIAIVPQNFNPATMFLDAMKDSVEIIERDGQKIGYIHIWSYADPVYQEQLETELIEDRLKDADGLIWDLRDGWGGASPTYLNIFTAPTPTITSVFRDGVKRQRNYQWQKPVVMLVNRGSRSGKEILAYGFRKYNVGQIVGSTTAGAVVAGSPFVMKDGSLLYLAVADVYVDGKRLEGEGVIPDIAVPFPIPYAQGNDPQKERAIETVCLSTPASFDKS
jgi:carboxyl-terminal processing protease